MSNLKNRSLISRQGRMCALFNFINLTGSEAKDFSGRNVILYCLLNIEYSPQPEAWTEALHILFWICPS